MIISGQYLSKLALVKCRGSCSAVENWKAADRDHDLQGEHDPTRFDQKVKSSSHSTNLATFEKNAICTILPLPA